MRYYIWKMEFPTINFCAIHEQCQKWREESWRLEGLSLIGKLTEESSQQISKAVLAKSSFSVNSFQSKLHQFQYERDKKVAKPLISSSDDGVKKKVDEYLSYESKMEDLVKLSESVKIPEKKKILRQD